MNYGYECKGWTRPEKQKLAAAISQEIQEGDFLDQHGHKPYLEVDKLYEGVRIRRITHLSEAQRDALIKHADALFLEHAVDGGHPIPPTGNW